MDINAPADAPKKKAKKKVKLSNSMIALILVVIGGGVLALSMGYIRPSLVDTNDELQSINDELSAQVAQVNEIAANEVSYSEQSAAFNADTAAILENYPAMVKEEDALIYARELEIESNNRTDIYKLNVSLGNLVYAIGVDSTDAAAAASTSTDDEDLTDDTSTDTTTTTDTTADTSTSSASSAYDLGILEESDVVLPTYQLFSVPVSWDFKSTYADLKTMIEDVLSHPSRRTIRSMSLSYDGGGENIVGTIDMNYYYLSGTDKVYEEPDTGITVRGKDNVYETIESPNYDDIKVSTDKKQKSDDSETEIEDDTLTE